MSNAAASHRNDQRVQFSPAFSDGSRNFSITIQAKPGLTQRQAEDLTDELDQLITSSRWDLVSVLRGVNEALRQEESPRHSSLTEAEIAALQAAGSLVDPVDALPIAERPSVRTALRQQRLLVEALTTEEVAHLLGVSTGRVRQRAGDGSLFTMPSTSRGLRFPRFQFTDGGELPGWGIVCRALPEHANPVAVEYFLSHTHPDLAEGELTPAQWLAAGKPAEPVAALAEQAFTIR